MIQGMTVAMIKVSKLVILESIMIPIRGDYNDTNNDGNQ